MQTARTAVAYELCDGFAARRLQTTWMMRGPNFLRSVLDQEGGEVVDALARSQGVEVIHEDEIVALQSRADGSSVIQTKKGREIVADMLGVGLGLALNTHLATEASIEVNRGVVYLLIGLGIGVASTRSIMNSLPVAKAGIGSAVNDLTRDLGGVLGLSGMGTLLAVRYTGYFTHIFASLPAAQAHAVSRQIVTTMSKSFADAVEIAQRYPAYAARILNAARIAFLQGSDAGYLFGIGAAMIAVLFVLFVYPKKAGDDATFAEVAKDEEDAPAFYVDESVQAFHGQPGWPSVPANSSICSASRRTAMDATG